MVIINTVNLKIKFLVVKGNVTLGNRRINDDESNNTVMKILVFRMDVIIWLQ